MAKKEDALTELLSMASPQILEKLILHFAASYPDVRRECFDYLKARVSVSKALENKSEGEIVLALWSELVPDLGELDEYGGGYHDVENRVADLLYEIVEKLETKKVASDYRRELLDLVLPYIESGNAGMDDLLDEIAHAACYNDGDLRLLAEAFEGMNDRWKKSRARRIYRQIGDREKYLELRYEQMETGSDYHDLATYHWDAGEKDKALQTAEKGLKKGKGRMDELRQFVAERAQKSGDRETYLSLQPYQTGVSWDRSKNGKIIS